MEKYFRFGTFDVLLNIFCIMAGLWMLHDNRTNTGSVDMDSARTVVTVAPAAPARFGLTGRGTTLLEPQRVRYPQTLCIVSVIQKQILRVTTDNICYKWNSFFKTESIRLI